MSEINKEAINKMIELADKAIECQSQGLGTMAEALSKAAYLIASPMVYAPPTNSESNQ